MDARGDRTNEVRRKAVSVTARRFTSMRCNQFSVNVVGDGGVITTHWHLSQRSVERRARNYG